MHTASWRLVDGSCVGLFQCLCLGYHPCREEGLPTALHNVVEHAARSQYLCCILLTRLETGEQTTEAGL